MSRTNRFGLFLMLLGLMLVGIGLITDPVPPLWYHAISILLVVGGGAALTAMNKYD